MDEPIRRVGALDWIVCGVLRFITLARFKLEPSPHDKYFRKKPPHECRVLRLI